ncbi:MAG TPA: alpha/beta hydrolase, partial [Thermomicrobiales bacterium]|nr:alpha/beta hydrolase [Thermomicrobiales bacterium]
LLDETSMAEETMQIGSLSLDRIAEITTPVVQIFSDRSAFLGTYTYLRDHLPSVESVLLPRSEWGHFGPLEQPELVADQILAALSGFSTVADAVSSEKEG